MVCLIITLSTLRDLNVNTIDDTCKGDHSRLFFGVKTTSKGTSCGFSFKLVPYVY